MDIIGSLIYALQAAVGVFVLSTCEQLYMRKSDSVARFGECYGPSLIPCLGDDPIVADYLIKINMCLTAPPTCMRTKNEETIERDQRQPRCLDPSITRDWFFLLCASVSYLLARFRKFGQFKERLTDRERIDCDKIYKNQINQAFLYLRGMCAEPFLELYDESTMALMQEMCRLISNMSQHL